MVDYKIEMIFWLNDERYAERYEEKVPSIGDKVRFKGIIYAVIDKIWAYDIGTPIIDIIIEKATEK